MKFDVIEAFFVIPILSSGYLTINLIGYPMAPEWHEYEG